MPMLKETATSDGRRGCGEELLRLRHPFSHSSLTALAAAIAVGIGVIASMYSVANAADTSSTMNRAHHACAVILGLDPSESPYETCIKSLDRSLSDADRNRQLAEAGRHTAMQMANMACADIGLEPGSNDFGQCVSDLRQSLADGSQAYK